MCELRDHLQQVTFFQRYHHIYYLPFIVLGYIYIQMIHFSYVKFFVVHMIVL